MATRDPLAFFAPAPLSRAFGENAAARAAAGAPWSMYPREDDGARGKVVTRDGSGQVKLESIDEIFKSTDPERVTRLINEGVISRRKAAENGIDPTTGNKIKVGKAGIRAVRSQAEARWAQVKDVHDKKDSKVEQLIQQQLKKPVREAKRDGAGDDFVKKEVQDGVEVFANRVMAARAPGKYQQLLVDNSDLYESRLGAWSALQLAAF